MSKALAERIAQILVEASKEIPSKDFVTLLERVLADTSTSDVAAIACFMPPELQGLLPRKYLH
jgi:hypothetical protein